jgi:hypothetical protein
MRTSAKTVLSTFSIEKPFALRIKLLKETKDDRDLTIITRHSVRQPIITNCNNT